MELAAKMIRANKSILRVTCHGIKTIFRSKMKEYILVTLLVALLSMLPFMFYEDPIFGAYLFSGYFSPEVYFSVWFPGYGGFYNVPPVQRYVFEYLLEHLFAIKVVSMIDFSLPFFVAGVSMYIFCRRFLKTRIIPAFIGAIFYMYNLCGQAFSYSPPDFTLAWAFLPLIAGYWLFPNKTSILKDSLIVSLLFLLMAPVNLTFIALYLLLAILVIIFKIIISTSEMIISIKSIASSLALSFLVTLPYYGTSIIMFFQKLERIAFLLSFETPAWLNSHSTILETIRLMGSVSMYYFIPGYGPAAPQFIPFISNPTLILLSLLFPVVAAIALVAGWRRSPYHLFFGILIVLSTFFAVGGNTSSPTSKLYMWLYRTIPWFSVFRDSYKAVIFLSFAYSALTALFVARFFQRSTSTLLNRIRRAMTVILLLTLILSVSYQFWGGEFLKNDTFKIPDYWLAYGMELRKSNRDFRILLAPEMAFPSYTWMTNPGNHPEYYLAWTNNRALALGSAQASHNYLILSETYSALEKGNTSLVFLNLYLLNVKYVAVQYDALWQINGRVSPNETEVALQKMGFPQVTRIGALTVYEVPYSNPPAKILALRPAPCIQASAIGVVEVSSLSCITSNLLPVSYVQNSPFSYTVHVNFSGPYWLIFSESYDPGWTLYLGEANNLLPVGTTLGKHYQLNNFSNAWYVSDNSYGKLILYFFPQIYFTLSIILAWVVFPVAVIYIFMRRLLIIR